MTSKTVYVIIFVMYLTYLPVSMGARGSSAQQLLSDLFRNYTSTLRPVEDTEDTLNVTLQIILNQIIDMDERNRILTTNVWVSQLWFDKYLTWNKDNYDGLDNLHLPSSYVWRPDIFLYNSVDDNFYHKRDEIVVLHNDGQIILVSPVITKSSCKVDVSLFPFDSQECNFTYGSWTYNSNQMDIQNATESGSLTDLVENVEWEVLGMPAKRNVVQYSCCSEPYTDVTYTLKLRRKSSFYIFNLLFPCVMLSFLAPLVFYLPADSGEKMSLGVTVLLAFTVFQLLGAEVMPRNENLTLLGQYNIAMLTMITASTALTIFIMNIHHCGPDAKPVPNWAKTFILKILARICCVYEVGENCMTKKSESQPKTALLQTSPSYSLGNLPSSRYGLWKEGTVESMDCGDGSTEEGKAPGQVQEGCKDHDGSNIPSCKCEQQRNLRNIEYVATCYRDQRALARKTEEWKKVAKVLDRFFMWVFFIMVFFTSSIIMGKSI